MFKIRGIIEIIFYLVSFNQSPDKVDPWNYNLQKDFEVLYLVALLQFWRCHRLVVWRPTIFKKYKYCTLHKNIVKLRELPDLREERIQSSLFIKFVKSASFS